MLQLSSSVCLALALALKGGGGEFDSHFRHALICKKTIVFATMLIPAPAIHNDTKWQLCWGGDLLSAFFDV